MELIEIQQQFSKIEQIRFYQNEFGLVMAEIKNANASCIISLHGAQILSYKPTSEKDILWMSEKSVFEDGKAIRGGIPICFPWFGPHSTDKTLPMHGFARIMYWEVEDVIQHADDHTELILKISDNDFTRKYWPFSFMAKLKVNLGKCLDVRLKIENTGQVPFTFSEALHTYFNISDTSNISIEGLANAGYYDGLQDNALKVQESEIQLISKEENRRYVNHSAMCKMTDTGFGRKINVAKKNSKTTVVWNPWTETIKSMPDMPLDSYKTMVCIEAANAFDNEVVLPAGESFEMITMICSQSL